jgi:lipopolysaccharide export LptBFGC system permease protein LptF
MSLLDRYVGRIALGAFLAALLFFLFLAVLMHLLNNVGKFASSAEQDGLGWGGLVLGLLGFYARMVPVLITTVTPFAVVTAAMFSVARLQHANEVVPMLFVGRSIRRVLLPVLLLGAVAGVGMAACWEWVVPHVGSDIASAQARLKQGSDEQKALVHERDENGERQYFYGWKFLPRTRTIERVALLVQGDLAADCQLLSADSAQWDEQRRDWRLVGGRCSRPGGGGNLAPTIDYAPREWLERPDLTPELLMQQSRDSIEPELLGYSELWQMLGLRPNRPDIRLALHRHVTHPLSCLLLLLLTLPLAVYYERGTRVERLLGAIALCAGYLLLDLICQSFGQRVAPDGTTMLHPVVAAWTPTIVFGSLGAVLFGGMRT